MAKRLFVVAAVLTGLLFQPVGAQAQTGTADRWFSFAKALPPSARIEVELVDGTRIRGNFIRVSPDAVQIELRKRLTVQTRQLPLVDIKSIEEVDTRIAELARQTDISAGYLGVSWGMRGWNAQVNAALSNHLALVGEVDGSYGTDCQDCLPTYHDLAFLGGARFGWALNDRVAVFGQGLAGVLHSTAQAYTSWYGYEEPLTINYFAVQPGGGVTVMITPRLGIRTQFDVQFAIPNQSEWYGISVFPRVVAGAVMRLGMRR